MTVNVLVTGFGPFPGAPVNPSAELIAMLDGSGGAFAGAKLHTRLLPVDYSAVPRLLETAGGEVRPDIAIHFGLAAVARGFRLESTARNHSSLTQPDAAGGTSTSSQICPGPSSLRSTLPLNDIAAALKARGLPVTRSAHAGAYLCNHTFYLSRSASIENFAPAMSGFVHIPYLDEQLPALPDGGAGLASLTRSQLLEGAKMIIETSITAYQAAA